MSNHIPENGEYIALARGYRIVPNVTAVKARVLRHHSVADATFSARNCAETSMGRLNVRENVTARADDWARGQGWRGR